MKRTGFARKTIERHTTTHTPIPPALRRNASMTPVGSAGCGPIGKANPLRCEAYRRAVASLPCKVCGIEGHSQAAHANQGKGLGIKSDDRTCFPLCHECHQQFDQGAMFDRDSRRKLEIDWGVDTRRTIDNLGQWPANLPKLQGHP